MAIDLNKLIEDVKQRDAEAKATAEQAQKSAGKTKSDSATLAKYRRYVDYANTLRGTRNTFESVIKRYASKIARGDKLDVLEQDELDNAVDQYNRLDAAIAKAQQDAYNIYTGRAESPAPVAGRVTGEGTARTQQAPRIEMPMGAGTPIAAGTQPTATSASTKNTIKDKNKRPENLPPEAKFTKDKGWNVQPESWFKGDKQWALNPDTNKWGWVRTDVSSAYAKLSDADKRKFNNNYALDPSTGQWTQEQDAKWTLPKLGIVSTVAPVGVTIDSATEARGDLKTLLAKTEFWYDLPDYLFQTVPELGNLLVKAVNEDWDEAKFLAAARLTPWWQTKTGTFRTRVIDKAKYNELRAAGQDVSKTAFGQYLSKQIASVKAQAKRIAGVTLSDVQAQQIAEKIYDGNLDDDPLAINRLIVPFISKITDRYAGKDIVTYGGEALQSYQTLQAIARANGLTLKDILPQVSTTLTGGNLEQAVLQGLATGDIDIQRVAQNARMVAAQGQPEYVRNLLNQGYDLEQVYAPYKRTMATILELEPDQIDLNDPTLRSAINNNGDMNIYDFKKALRKDSRWQYTENAREEVSNVALQVLRDFGFQG